jgi:hypothetical protein
MVHHSVTAAKDASTSETRIMTAAAKAVPFPIVVGTRPTGGQTIARNAKAKSSSLTAYLQRNL